MKSFRTKFLPYFVKSCHKHFKFQMKLVPFWNSSTKFISNIINIGSNHLFLTFVYPKALNLVYSFEGAQKRKMFLEKENRKKPTPIMNTRSKFAKSAKSTKTKLCNDTRYSHELCASLDCSHPKEAKNTWVQCEDCDDWYHLQCAGLKVKDAKKRNTVYHCGCNWNNKFTSF